MARKTIKPLTKKQLEQKQIISEYKKQYARISKAVEKAISKGFNLQYQLPQKLNTKTDKISKREVNKLKRVTKQTIYKGSVATSSITGLPITGKQKLAEERRISSQKGWETRRAKLEQISRQDVKFEKAKRMEEQVAIDRLSQDENYRLQFGDGEIVYNELMRRINSVGVQDPQSAQDLRDILDKAITEADGGRDEIMLKLSKLKDDIISATEYALSYDSNDPRHLQACDTIEDMLRSHPLTSQEQRDRGDRYDRSGQY